MSSTDRIEKQIELHAPVARVWRALTDAGEFGTWFRVTFDRAFAEGQAITGHMAIPGYEHLTLEIVIERMDAETLFSYRWHPFAVDQSMDYSKEPMTLVEFRLEASATGTTLRVTESGFDTLPRERYAEAFRMNDKGWTSQIENIRKHVAG